jgi:hypothetical protein
LHGLTKWEKKIFEISANQRLLWPLAAILDNRSKQKVTTIDQNLVRNISYLAEMFLARSLSSVVTFCSDRPPFKMAAVTKYRIFFQLSKMSSNFNCSYITMSSLTYIPDFSVKCFLVTAAILNGGRSEQKVTTLDKDLARNISAKYGSNLSNGS